MLLLQLLLFIITLNFTLTLHYITTERTESTRAWQLTTVADILLVSVMKVDAIQQLFSVHAPVRVDSSVTCSMLLQSHQVACGIFHTHYLYLHTKHTDHWSPMLLAGSVSGRPPSKWWWCYHLLELVLNLLEVQQCHHTFTEPSVGSCSWWVVSVGKSTLS